MGPQTSPAPAQSAPKKRKGRVWVWLTLLLLVGVASYRYFPQVTQGASGAPQGAAEKGAGKRGAQAVPVIAAVTRRGDLGVYLTGLGSVAAYNTVTIRSRIDGELIKVAFSEGQMVEQGDLLAEIDPRPYEAQLAQAEGQLARDTAQLDNARLDAKRYETLS